MATWFVSFLGCRRLVKFKKVTDPHEEGFTLELTQDTSYDQVGCVYLRKAV